MVDSIPKIVHRETDAAVSARQTARFRVLSDAFLAADLMNMPGKRPSPDVTRCSATEFNQLIFEVLKVVELHPKQTRHLHGELTRTIMAQTAKYAEKTDCSGSDYKAKYC